jgi:iron complex transport system ATP-binding protein
MLEARGLAFGYPGRVIGKDVVLGVAPGEAVALLGPNGGGKTTLLKTLLGLLPAVSGEVLLDGEPLLALPVAERARRLAYVPQAHTGAFAFTALEMVTMGRTARGGLLGRPGPRDLAVARAMLDQMGVGHLGDRPYTMISGGERQLVFVARALAQEPRYVVLDEPTASLDFGNQGLVMRRIRELASTGLGVLFTTHDPNQALRHADRTVMLRDGRLDRDGPSAEVIGANALEQLYGASVETIDGHNGRRAYLPS